LAISVSDGVCHAVVGSEQVEQHVDQRAHPVRAAPEQKGAADSSFTPYKG